MNKFLIIILFIQFFAIHSKAQNSVTKDLIQILINEKQDTNRVKLLAELSRKYWYSKPDTAMLLAVEGLSLARKINFKTGEGNCLNILGRILVLTGNYPRSLETCFQALMIFESTDDKLGIGNSTSNIAYSYGVQGDYKQYLIYCIRTKIIAELLLNDSLLLPALINMGDAYEKLNVLDSALFYTQKAYDLTIRINSINTKGTVLNNLGNIFSKMGRISTAMENYKGSIHAFIEENDNEGICEATLGIAELFKKRGTMDSALYYARISLSEAKLGGFTKRLLNASIFLWVYYDSVHIIDSAYTHQKTVMVAKDSLYNQEKTKQVQNLAFAEEMRQLEIAEANAKEREKRKQNIQLAGIGAFIPLFFSIILLFRKSTTKAKIIEFLGLLGLLMLFEFIALFLHPHIEEWTHHKPVLMLLILVTVASFLVPLHHKLEHWIKEKIVYKKLKSKP